MSAETPKSVMDGPLWRDQFVLSRDLTIPAERSEFFRRARNGEYIRIQRGVWMSRDCWEDLDGNQRYRARIHGAAAYFGRNIVFSHQSAAALWRLPWLGQWPTALHLLGRTDLSGRSNSTVIRHSSDRKFTTERIDELIVTSLLDTVVDLARTVPFEASVVALDAALRRTLRPETGVPATSLVKADLLERLHGEAKRNGSIRAEAAIRFADERGDSPGESLSRIAISRAKLTPPELQVPLRGASGRVWIVDFWWPEINLIGEFDGETKYTNPQFLQGRTPAQVVVDEKWREDDLRAAGPRMVRWGWSTARSAARMREKLVRVGVR